MAEAEEEHDWVGLLGKRASNVMLMTYGVGLLVSPVLLYPLFGYLEHETDTHDQAIGAFVTVCVVAAGLPPVAMLPFAVIGRALARRRARRRISLEHASKPAAPNPLGAVSTSRPSP